MNRKVIILGGLIILIVVSGIIIYLNMNEDNKLKTIVVEYDTNDENTTIPDEYTSITLANNNTKIDGTGASEADNTVTIYNGGAYVIDGTLTNGNIIVEASKSENVQLFLNEVDITCDDYSPISIAVADKTIITLIEGTTNTLTDGVDYSLKSGEDEPNATLYSKDDLTINGAGELVITANYNNGITSKDDLKILNGNIKITAVNHAIKGKDMVAIKGSNIEIKSSGDGIKSTNTEDASLGYITIENSTINIISNEDGIQAQTNLSLTNNTFDITTGGGSKISSTSSSWGNNWGSGNANDQDSSTSAKGLKADNNIIIESGTYIIDSSDDSIHSNNKIQITNGTFKISSGDDGIHADTALEISGGTINILKSYEGLESTTITINGGTFDITASDDGINAAGGDGSATGNRPGQGGFSGTVGEIFINGGSIEINAGGDGVDSNNIIEMDGGVLIINGPTTGGNSAIDADGGFTINGGTLIAAGTSDMAEMPGTSSNQNSLMLNFTSNNSANTTFKLTNSSGTTIIEYAPTKSYQNIVVSSPKLNDGEYSIYLNNKLYDTVTINSITTKQGSSSNGMTNPGGPGGNRR